MSVQPTAKHQQEAREIVTAHAEHSVVVRQEQLIDTFASALSSRDTEIREALAGLRRAYDMNGDPCWCASLTDTIHDVACLATRVLWNKVQG